MQGVPHPRDDLRPWTSGRGMWTRWWIPGAGGGGGVREEASPAGTRGPPQRPTPRSQDTHLSSRARALLPCPRNWARVPHPRDLLPPSTPQPPVPAHLHKVPINTFSLSYLRSLNSLPAREPASRRPLAPRGAAPLILAPRAARGVPDPARPVRARGRPRARGAPRGGRLRSGGRLRPEAGLSGRKAGAGPHSCREEMGRGASPGRLGASKFLVPHPPAPAPLLPPATYPLPSPAICSTQQRRDKHGSSSLPPLPSPLPKLSTPPPGRRDFWRQLPPRPKAQLGRGQRPAPLPRSEDRWGCR